MFTTDIRQWGELVDGDAAQNLFVRPTILRVRPVPQGVDLPRGPVVASRAHSR